MTSLRAYPDTFQTRQDSISGSIYVGRFHVIEIRRYLVISLAMCLPRALFLPGATLKRTGAVHFLPPLLPHRPNRYYMTYMPSTSLPHRQYHTITTYVLLLLWHPVKINVADMEYSLFSVWKNLSTVSHMGGLCFYSTF